MVLAPILCTSGGLPAVVSIGRLSHTSLSSEPPRLERGNTGFALLLSSGQPMEVFLQPLPFSRFPLLPCEAVEHSRSAELRLQVGVEVSCAISAAVEQVPFVNFPLFSRQCYIYLSSLPVPSNSPSVTGVNRICLSP